MSDHSVTEILRQLRAACTEDDRQAAAADLYQRFGNKVEQLARGRLPVGGGLADEHDVAQSAFRSFFCRIETGKLDALVNGGQAWAMLSRLTRNKAVDSLRYNNAACRGGEGSRRGNPSGSSPSSDSSVSKVASSEATRSTSTSGLSHNRLPSRPTSPREEVPLEGIHDQNQRSAAEVVASNELLERFLEALSEATLRGIVSLKLDGFTNQEIGEKLGCATRTVERKLNLIRRLWIPILEDSDEGRQG